MFQLPSQSILLAHSSHEITTCLFSFAMPSSVSAGDPRGFQKPFVTATCFTASIHFRETSWSGKYHFGAWPLLESPDPYVRHATKVLTTTRVSMLPFCLTALLQIIRPRLFNSHLAVLLFFYIDCDCDGPPARSLLQRTPIGVD